MVGTIIPLHFKTLKKFHASFGFAVYKSVVSQSVVTILISCAKRQTNSLSSLPHDVENE